MNKPRFPAALEPRLPPHLIAAVLDELESEDRFEEARVTGSVLGIEAEYVEFTSSRLTAVALTGSVFDNLSLVDVVIDDAELSGVTLGASSLTRVEFRQCRMSGLAAPGLKVRDAKFVNCKLDSANFHMTTWQRCEFVDCELQGVEFTAASLSATQFRNCQLQRADFSQATLKDVVFHGSSLEVVGGAAGMRGAVIASDQVLPFALSVFASLGIEVTDDLT